MPFKLAYGMFSLATLLLPLVVFLSIKKSTRKSLQKNENLKIIWKNNTNDFAENKFQTSERDLID